MNNMKIILIGGSGFLGSHIADALTKVGHKVIIFDNKDSKYLKLSQKMIVGDIMKLEDLVKASKNCDVMYNFAGLSDIDEAKLMPIKTAELNILGNLNALEAARINKIKRFVFASSLYVYSKMGSFYRVSKQASENFVESYFESYGMEYTILRFGSLYGPRSDSRNGLYRIVKNALKTNKITYEGSEKARREYIHVYDAANAGVEILNDDYINQNIVLTGLQKIKVLNILEMLQEILGEKHEINFVKATYEGHYIHTPYTYQPKLGKKYHGKTHIDLGQGLIQLIEEIAKEIY
jgi:UDP-glucose 4-epimerase